MKSIVVNEFGLDKVTIEERKKPEIKANEVLVAVEAVSLNYVDIMIARGDFPLALPYVLGCDAAGIVEAIGSDVGNFRPGDRVSTQHMREWINGPITEDSARLEGRTLGGAFSQYIAVAENGIMKAPSHLSPEEASTLPIAAVTAWQALFHTGRIAPGNTVLVQGAGGVSVFALQFAKAAGLHVIVSSSSESKLRRARELGADFTVNYRENPEWYREVLRLTGGKGVDLAVEVGGVEINKTRQGVRFGGTIAAVGTSAGAIAELDVLALLQRPVTIVPIEVGSRYHFQEMNRFIELSGLKPVIDKVFPLAQVTEALEYAAGSRQFGKVVIKF
jgi:NADPH:quinone reductase-like Zn-dependent oxidoreductase